MSDGDTRKANADAHRDPYRLMAPFAKFKSFKRADQIWVLGGLAFLVILLNIVFGLGN